MAMRRTSVDGRTLNQRTADMLALWQFNCLKNFYVLQGSYNAGRVGASAGTHDGGGAVDLSVAGWTNAYTDWVVKQGRLAGFAAWHRDFLPGVWTEHIHAIAVGDPELSAGAQRQVASYYAGRNGLANNGPDDGAKVTKHVYPNVTLKSVSLLAVRVAWAAKRPKSNVSVARVQWCLNEKLGTHLVTDGVCGPKTKAAFKKYNAKIPNSRPDGTPGRVALRALGKGRFKLYTISYDKWYKSKVERAHQVALEKRK